MAKGGSSSKNQSCKGHRDLAGQPLTFHAGEIKAHEKQQFAQLKTTVSGRLPCKCVRRNMTENKTF